MYGRYTPRPFISGQLQHHQKPELTWAGFVPRRRGKVPCRLASECLSSARSRDLAKESNLCRGTDDHSYRMQWSQRFQPGTMTRLSAPDISKQPHQPQLSLALEPLRKVLASGGIDSYQKCRSIVLGGHVSVNGVLERHPQRLVDPREDRIFVKGRLLEPERVHASWMLHKPTGVTCSLSPAADAIFTSLIEILRSVDPERLRDGNESLHIVSRLAVHSSGMQLVTSDSDWSRQVTKTSHVDQEYVVTVASIPSNAQIASIRMGCNAVTPCSVQLAQVNRNRMLSRWRITVKAGRCLDICARFSFVGMQCLHVKRTRIGGLILPKSVPPGKGLCLQAWQVQQVLHLDACRSAALNRTPEIFRQSVSTFKLTFMQTAPIEAGQTTQQENDDCKNW